MTEKIEKQIGALTLRALIGKDNNFRLEVVGEVRDDGDDYAAIIFKNDGSVTLRLGKMRKYLPPSTAPYSVGNIRDFIDAILFYRAVKLSEKKTSEELSKCERERESLFQEAGELRGKVCDLEMRLANMKERYEILENLIKDVPKRADEIWEEEVNREY